MIKRFSSILSYTFCASTLAMTYACASSEPKENSIPDASENACVAENGVVRFDTEDGVTLEADLARPEGSPQGAVVLLHMIPPSNDRSNYSQAFIDALTAQDLMVLNVDRRGAGASQGTALEAYEGAKGVLDAQAAVAQVVSTGCVSAAEVALVGASNGTTTVFDYVVAAESAPKAVVFLTAGPYTENQNTMAAQKDKLSMPTLFVWHAEEARIDVWTEPMREGAPASWTFSEYNPGGHGTINFSAAPQSINDVATFLGNAFN